VADAKWYAWCAAVCAATLAACGGTATSEEAVTADAAGAELALSVDAADDADAGATDASPADAVLADSDAGTDATAEDAAPVVDASADGAAGPDANGDAATASDGTALTDAVAPIGAPTTVWDQTAVADAATANCQFTNKHTALEGLTALDVWNVSYTSWEVVDGVPKAILIRGFAARPQGGSKLPGVVQAHGLGGMSKENDATSLAAKLGMFAIAYTGPGGGDKPENTSEGLGAAAQNGYHLFDTQKDIRGTWFWGHATAAMRAVTCLTTRVDVDATKLGVTGFSAGGVVSTLLAAHDARIVAAVPLSGTLAWDVATQSPTAWQNDLLKQAGLSIASPEWQKLISDLIAPSTAFTAASKAHLFALDGSTDEFFPLTALMATWNVVGDPDKRLSLSANFDHGCYSVVPTVEDKTKIENRATEHADGAQRMWFHHWFGTDTTYSYLPVAPQVSVQSAAGATLIAAVVDPGGSKLQVDSVHAWVSADDAYTFIDVPLDKANGAYSKLVAGTQAPNTVYFVDVTYTPKALSLTPVKVSISSVPVMPAGFVPHIRAMTNCL
jgi:dienelactone hydrolase